MDEREQRKALTACRWRFLARRPALGGAMALAAATGILGLRYAMAARLRPDYLLAVVAAAELLALLLVVPAWTAAFVERELRSGRCGDLLAAGCTSRTLTANLTDCALRFGLWVSVAPLPVTLLAGALGGQGAGGALRCHLVLAAIAALAVVLLLASAANKAREDEPPAGASRMPAGSGADPHSLWPVVVKSIWGWVVLTSFIALLGMRFLGAHSVAGRLVVGLIPVLGLMDAANPESPDELVWAWSAIVMLALVWWGRGGILASASRQALPLAGVLRRRSRWVTRPERILLGPLRHRYGAAPGWFATQDPVRQMEARLGWRFISPLIVALGMGPLWILVVPVLSRQWHPDSWPGLMVGFVAAGALASVAGQAAVSVLRDKAYGMLPDLLLTRLTAWQIVAGKVRGACARQFGTLALTLAAAGALAALHQVSPLSVLHTGLSLAVFPLAVAAVAVGVALRCRNSDGVVLALSALGVPTVLCVLSGMIGERPALWLEALAPPWALAVALRRDMACDPAPLAAAWLVWQMAGGLALAWAAHRLPAWVATEEPGP